MAHHPTKVEIKRGIMVEIPAFISEMPDKFHPNKKLPLFLTRESADILEQTIADHSLYPAPESQCKKPFREYEEKETGKTMIAMRCGAAYELGSAKIEDWTRWFGGKDAYVEGELRPYDLEIEQDDGMVKPVQGVSFTVHAIRNNPKDKVDERKPLPTGASKAKGKIKKAVKTSA